MNNFVETVVKSNAASNPGKEEEDNIPEDSPYYRQTPFAYRTKEEAEQSAKKALENELLNPCLLYTSPSPRDRTRSRMPSSA